MAGGLTTHPLARPTHLSKTSKGSRTRWFVKCQQKWFVLKWVLSCHTSWADDHLQLAIWILRKSLFITILVGQVQIWGIETVAANRKLPTRANHKVPNMYEVVKTPMPWILRWKVDNTWNPTTSNFWMNTDKMRWNHILLGFKDYKLWFQLCICMHAKTLKKVMKKSALTQTVEDYASRSSIHGISYVFDRELSIIDRLLWLLVVFASLAFATAFTWNFWRQWRDDQVQKYHTEN